MKKWMLLMLAAIAAIAGQPMFAEENATGANHEFTYEDVEYRVIDEDARTCMTKPRDYWYNCSDGKTTLVIPEEVSDGTCCYKVVEIGEYSFYHSSDLVSVVLPESVRTVGDYAFSACDKIETIAFPPSLAAVGRGAFSGCTSLTKIDVPDGVEHINDYTFSGCTSLASVKLPSNLRTIGEAAFRRCGLEEVDLPDSLEVIEDGNQEEDGYYVVHTGAFSSTKLKRISLPDNIKKVGAYAFAQCNDLEYIEFPKYLREIGYGVCCMCQCLNLIEFPDSLKTIGREAFWWCESLQRVDIPKGTERIADCAFEDCWNLKTIVFPESLKELGSRSPVLSRCSESSGLDIYYLTSSPKNVADGRNVADGKYGAFGEKVYQYGTLYVGIGGLEGARKTEPWKNFVNIKESVMCGVEKVKSDSLSDSNVPVEVFDLQGRRVAYSEDGLPSGLYIIKEGDRVKKVRIN